MPNYNVKDMTEMNSFILFRHFIGLSVYFSCDKSERNIPVPMPKILFQYLMTLYCTEASYRNENDISE